MTDIVARGLVPAVRPLQEDELKNICNALKESNSKLGTEALLAIEQLLEMISFFKDEYVQLRLDLIMRDNQITFLRNHIKNRR
jgi:hypothetical protein